MTLTERAKNHKKPMARYWAKKQLAMNDRLSIETNQQKGPAHVPKFAKCGASVGDRNAGRRNSPWWVE